MSAALTRPRKWPGSAVEKFLLAETTNAMPWLLTSGYWPMMPNTKAVEKDATACCSFAPWKRSGVGWKACPFSAVVPLVSMSRPSGVTVAMPSRERFAPEKPLKVNTVSFTAATRWSSVTRKRKNVGSMA